MKKTLFVLWVSLLFVCDLSSQDRVPVDSLKVSIENNCFFSLYNGIPFTGIGYSVYENGNLSLLYKYQDGICDGLKLWYENGQIRQEIKYKEDKVDGIYRRWYENGQLKEEENYKEGKKDGLSKQWDEKGSLVKEENWKNGVIQ